MNKLSFKSVCLFFVLGFFGSAHAQDFSILKNSIRFWVGSGTDSGAVVVTFPGDGFSDSSFIWGVLFNDSISGGDMLQAIEMEDVNFDFKNLGGFLDSVNYNNHSGYNAVNNFWWNTFSLNNGNWEFNSGLTAFMHQEGVYGISYTDSDTSTWMPNRLPTLNPVPALNPQIISITDFDNNQWRWFGEGNSKAIMVIDFAPNLEGKSFAFGVQFDDTTTGLELLQKIAFEDSTFQFNASGFLNDIYFHSDSGIGGAPNYWGTWSATNYGNWISNMGISTVVKDGDFFACTYTDFNPALRPSYPQVIQAPQTGNTSIVETEKTGVQVYPNPFNSQFTIELEGSENASITIFTIEGKEMVNTQFAATTTISTSDWNVGIYIGRIESKSRVMIIRIIKE